MELVLSRRFKKEKYTMGILYVDGEKFCNVIEDTDRGLRQNMPLDYIKHAKVYGETAIPTGKYQIAMNIISPKYSQKEAFSFTKGYMPRLMNVPGWEGVLIHTGNTQEDSLGCLIVGKNTEVGKVTSSTAYFKKLYSLLKKASDRGEKITIIIE